MLSGAVVMGNGTWSQRPTKRTLITPRAAALAGSPLDQNAAISVRGLQLSFGGGGSRKQVLAGVDFDVPQGTFHMLLGANGCGKSTLLRVVAGLTRSDAGLVHSDSPKGFVFQNPDHQVVLPTVAADVAFGLGRYNLTRDEVSASVGHALARVGLAACANRPTASLSGGQKQRVAIAGALAENPRLLLLDELTTFLDGSAQRSVLECVRKVVNDSRARSGAAGEEGAASARPDFEFAAVAAASGGSNSSSSSGSGRGGLPFSSWFTPRVESQQVGGRAARINGSGGGGSSSGGGEIFKIEEGVLDNPVTAVWVTHRLEELEYADGVSVMHGGKVVFSGSAAEARQVLRRLG